MPFVGTEQGEIYYHQVGAGAPLVLVNDWPLSHQYWGPVVYLLRQSFSAITFDPRGMGRSTSFSEHAAFDVETHAEDVHGLITSLGLGDVHLIGHSIGAMVAALCAQAHPQDVRTLTVINPGLRPGAPEAVESYLKYAQVILMLKNLTALPLVRNLILRRYSYGRVPEVYRRVLLGDFVGMNVRAAWEVIHSATEEQNLRTFARSLSSCPRPVLIVTCSKDRLSSVGVARWFYERIRTGMLITMNNCFHFPMLEVPEKFAKLLADFYMKSAHF